MGFSVQSFLWATKKIGPFLISMSWFSFCIFRFCLTHMIFDILCCLDLMVPIIKGECLIFATLSLNLSDHYGHARISQQNTQNKGWLDKLLSPSPSLPTLLCAGWYCTVSDVLGSMPLCLILVVDFQCASFQLFPCRPSESSKRSLAFLLTMLLSLSLAGCFKLYTQKHIYMYAYIYIHIHTHIYTYIHTHI